MLPKSWHCPIPQNMCHQASICLRVGIEPQFGQIPFELASFFMGLPLMHSKYFLISWFFGVFLADILNFNEHIFHGSSLNAGPPPSPLFLLRLLQLLGDFASCQSVPSLTPTSNNGLQCVAFPNEKSVRSTYVALLGACRILWIHHSKTL